MAHGEESRNEADGHKKQQNESLGKRCDASPRKAGNVKNVLGPKWFGCVRMMQGMLRRSLVPTKPVNRMLYG